MVLSVVRARRPRERRQVCTGCRREFIPARRDARFCSDACRFRAYRRRLAAKAADDDLARLDHDAATNLWIDAVASYS
jgi:hypothetical protein